MAHLDQSQLQMINVITEALSSSDCRKLIYLCESLETDCCAELVKETLKSKVENTGDAHLFLKALISCLGRYDVLKKVYKVCRTEIEQKMQTYENIFQPFRVLMINISEEMSTEDVEEIKFLFGNTLSREKVKKSKSFLDVIVELEKLDLVSPERVDIVGKCLLDIGRVDLVKKVNCYKMSARVNMVVPVHKEAACGSPMERYNLNTNPRGVCVIIDCVGNGGEMLEQTFKALHFNVSLYLFLTSDLILLSLREILRPTENHIGDAFVCCIISRGSTHRLLGTDEYGGGFAIDCIRNLFTGDACPMLAGKPKLFFIQRYNVVESNLNYVAESVEVDGFNRQPASGSIPKEADIFWSHCWTDERQLLQRKHHSVYLKALTDALHDAQRRKLNLVDVQMRVNGAIFEHNRRNPGAAYSIDVKHTLRKNLYLD
ncbi:CASP8 and FADD-like apoptosis regulator isoform X2 [Nothobranchius furzeri]|uniref:CASP8 and FADD-like apoptosis regulator n=1 Tax=Nothobranchius furzeri TaxID=105023 RepID=A0A1A8A6K4_NOTFU|nr:CASP8 and FADD-like apoptosis regulator isoform X3 [Nothobranchius furzeri]